MNHLFFGPVISRRLGRSLGIDLIPFKTCSYNCVYCECGATTNLTLKRDEFFKTDEIIHQVDIALSSSPKLDYITFAGSGEPTLSLSLARVITHLKNHYTYKVAVLTNGSLFPDPDVRRDILLADLVIPTITTTRQEMFERVHRPVPGLSIREIIRGLQYLRTEYTGRIWLEVFVIPGLNTTETELSLLRSAVYAIRPDRIQLNYLDRPGTEAWVSSPEPVLLRRIREFFAEGGIPVDITGFDEITPLLDQDDSIAQIDETLRRRPCTAEDLAQMTGLSAPEVRKKLALMAQQGIIQAKTCERGIFYWIPPDA